MIYKSVFGVFKVYFLLFLKCFELYLSVFWLLLCCFVGAFGKKEGYDVVAFKIIVSFLLCMLFS